MNENPKPPEDPAAPLVKPEELARREFFSRLSLLLGGGIAIGLSAPLVVFVLGPLTHKKQEVWRIVGKVDDFKVGETVAVRYEDPSALPWAGVTARAAAWLRRINQTEFIAFSIHCTHLGCPVRWMADAQLFLCPCHGGVFYQDGTVAAGPPERPLTRYSVRTVNGEVQIRPEPLPIVTRE